MQNEQKQDKDKIIATAHAPVLFSIRSLPDNTVRATKKLVVNVPLFTEDIKFLEATAKEEHISYEAAILEHVRFYLNNLESIKKTIAQFKEMYPKVKDIIVDTELYDKVTLEKEK